MTISTEILNWSPCREQETGVLSTISKWDIYVKLLSPRIRIFKEEGGQSVGTKMADNIKDTVFSKYNRTVTHGPTASVTTCTKLHKLKTEKIPAWGMGA